MRDYRYYADDLVQPSSLGLKIVWEAFCQTFFEEETRWALDKVEKVQNLAQHRLTTRSNPEELGRKGLRLLDDLERSGAELESIEIRERFRQWVAGSKV